VVRVFAYQPAGACRRRERRLTSARLACRRANRAEDNAEGVAPAVPRPFGSGIARYCAHEPKG
jgi:hypothetical protein